MTQTLPETTDDTLTHWPPKSHIVRREDLPAKEGTVALCGAKLMGTDLKGNTRKAQCDRCQEIMRRELRERGLA